MLLNFEALHHKFEFFGFLLDLPDLVFGSGTVVDGSLVWKRFLDTLCPLPRNVNRPNRAACHWPGRWDEV